MEVMYLRKKNRRVEVYAIDAVNGMAVIYDPCVAAGNPGHGGGWQRVKLSSLIPEKYYNPITGDFQSKTEKNHYKSRLQLIAATWQCSDGEVFDHADIELAINHERELDAEHKQNQNGETPDADGSLISIISGEGRLHDDGGSTCNH